MNPKIDVMIVTLDLSDNTSVQQAAKTINSSIDHLDVLVNNAGVMAIKDYIKSADGFEMHFASNYLGHFLLTNLLMGKIIAAKGVIINVSSTAHIMGEVNFEDPSFQACVQCCKIILQSRPYCAKMISRAARLTTRGWHMHSPRQPIFYSLLL
jgi:NAD(P)-dependent dehydrogenase (short-subunit alcohol dehydrogenase family)